jgi:hypothetical protein
MRTAVLIADSFYAEPMVVREYASCQPFYYPYQPDQYVRSGALRPSWMTSRYRAASDCPFKSSRAIISIFERLTGETVDLDHWRLDCPTSGEGKADMAKVQTQPHSCLWNCSFHVKLQNAQPLGEGVHNHVTDAWNSVGEDGWAGIIYLDPSAPLDGGLKLWRNRDLKRQFDWMTPRENWELIDDLGNVFNRLLLVRGDIPHSGAAGWGDSWQTGRLFQTFFFKVTRAKRAPAVTLPAVSRQVARFSKGQLVNE